MALITKNNTFSAGAVIVASEHNDNFDVIFNDYNGNITNANVVAGAAIADTKLAQITTASKVSFSALDETSEAAGVVAGHDGTNWSSISVSTQRYRVLMSQGSLVAASFQTINLTSAHSITGTLPVANGGTGGTGDSIVKAWVNFDGLGTLSVSNSFNVSQVLVYGTGKYGVYWDTDFANSTYACVAIAHNQFIAGISSVKANRITINTTDTGGASQDSPLVHVIALGDQ